MRTGDRSATYGGISKVAQGNFMSNWHRISLCFAWSAVACGLSWQSLHSGQPPAGQPTVSIERIRSDVKYLSSDELQGRGVGSRGEELAVEFIARQFEKAGLTPAGDR